jgi:hypothetical protein
VEREERVAVIECVEKVKPVLDSMCYGHALATRPHFFGGTFPRPRIIGRHYFVVDPLQLSEELDRVGSDLSDSWKATECLRFVESGLGRCAQDYRHSILRYELSQSIKNRVQEVRRHCLRFVENNHAARNSVQLATLARRAAE